MSYATSAQSFSLFPASPASPHAFSMFSISQSPRETHALFEDLFGIFNRPAAALEPSEVLQPSNGRENTLKRSRSTPSLKKSWRKLLGLQPTEPVFEFVTPQSRPGSPPSEEDVSSPGGSIADEDFGILSCSPVLGDISGDEDGTSTDGTLVEEELEVVPTASSPFHAPDE